MKISKVIIISILFLLCFASTPGSASADGATVTMTLTGVSDTITGILYRDDIASLNYGNGTTSGAGAGRAAFKGIVITKMVDNTTPLLHMLMAKGIHIKDVIITFNDTGYIVSLSGAVITEISSTWGGINGLVEISPYINGLQEAITFGSAQVICWAYPSGGSPPSIKTCYDTVKNIVY